MINQWTEIEWIWKFKKLDFRQILDKNNEKKEEISSSNIFAILDSHIGKIKNWLTDNSRLIHTHTPT